MGTGKGREDTAHITDYLKLNTRTGYDKDGDKIVMECHVALERGACLSVEESLRLVMLR